MTSQSFPETLDPVVLAVAPNGGRRTKTDHPALPLSVAELASTVRQCQEAGAAMAHLHVRRIDGRHLLDGASYREAIRAVRCEIGDKLFLQISSEALGLYRPEEQMAVVREAKPEGVSLALREFMADPAGERAFAEFLSWLKRERIAPQFILYAPEEADQLGQLWRRGIIPWENPPVLYVLGRYSAQQTSAPDDLMPFFGAGKPLFKHWMVCAFGRHEAACATTAAQRGGHARVGFENNFHLPGGSIAPSNSALVRETVLRLATTGRPLASAAHLRTQWLSL